MLAEFLFMPKLTKGAISLPLDSNNSNAFPIKSFVIAGIRILYLKTEQR